MESIAGYLEGDRFFPEQPMKMPKGRRKIIVTLLDESPVDKHERNRQAWLKFLKGIAECDEPPPEGMPERIRFDRVLD